MTDDVGDPVTPVMPVCLVQSLSEMCRRAIADDLDAGAGEPGSSERERSSTDMRTRGEF